MAVFPRSKASELQEAYNHREYFTRQGEALASVQERIKADLALCMKNMRTWEGRIEKLEEKKA